MGSTFATELADNDLLGLDLETQIGIHLSSNHYPPVPRSMVQPCIDAIPTDPPLYPALPRSISSNLMAQVH